MRLKPTFCQPNQKCDVCSAPPLLMIKSTPAWCSRCVEFGLGGITTVRFTQLLGPLKPDSSPANCNEIHRHVFVEDAGTDVTVTFSNWSRFLVRQLGEISPHPHKETLPARLLTRTQARKKTMLIVEDPTFGNYWEPLIC